jgi:hypothetical protein
MPRRPHASAARDPRQLVFLTDVAFRPGESLRKRGEAGSQPADRCGRNFDVQQLSGSVQILHLAPGKLPEPAEPDGAQSYSVRLPALDPRMQWGIPKEQKDALDNLRSSSGFVGAGNGHLLYRRRADSPFVSHRADSAGISFVSRAQDRLTNETTSRDAD